MALKGGAAHSEVQAMAELAKMMWDRFMKPKVTSELMRNMLRGYKATVESNNQDGTLTVKQPFDVTPMTLKCPPGLASTAQAGDQVLVISLGDLSNSFVLCATDLSGFGSTDRPSVFNFSTLDSDGYYTVLFANGMENTYLTEEDSQGRIVKITNTSDGFETEVIWE